MGLFDQMRLAGLGLSEQLASHFCEEKLSSYYDFLESKNEIGGFFSKADSERILERHLFECMLFVAHSLYSDDSPFQSLAIQSVADVGTGPGLPGYLYSCLHSPRSVKLVDSSKRRLSLLESFHSERPQEQSKVDFCYGRSEELKWTADLVVARALIPFPYSLEICSPLSSVARAENASGCVALFVGGRVDIKKSKRHLDALGFELLSQIQPLEMQCLGERSILYLRRVAKPKAGWPRPWRKIKTEMKEG